MNGSSLRKQQFIYAALLGSSLLCGFAVVGRGQEAEPVSSAMAARAAARRQSAAPASYVSPTSTARSNGHRTAPAAQRPGNSFIRPVQFSVPSGSLNTPGYVPRHQRMTGTMVFQDSEYSDSVMQPMGDPMPMGETIIQSNGGASVVGDHAGPHVPGEIIYEDGGIIHEGGWGEPVCGGCGECDMCCAPVCWPCLPCLPCLPINPENLALNAGVFGATGPRNFAGGTRTGTASFGFMEGANWGSPVPCFGGLGMQFGFNATQSNLSGAQFTDERHRQVFVTGGAFRRVDCGLQAGLVVDYLHDEWYSTLNLTQFRGEASWVYPGSHELGFWFTASLNNDRSDSITQIGTAAPVTTSEAWQATDLFAFFYRYRDPCTGGNGRLFAGFTGASDGLIGADVELPITDTIAVRSAFTYLVPEQGPRAAGPQEEGWNLGINIVWRPCGRLGGCSDYYTPLFTAADNGTFMIDRR
ncbi:MAG: DUF6666 family protein [Pirellulaceae bacterium]